MMTVLTHVSYNQFQSPLLVFFKVMCSEVTHNSLINIYQQFIAYSKQLEINIGVNGKDLHHFD